MKKPLLFLSYLFYFSCIAQAQTLSTSAINVSGNSFSKGFYSFDWSLGEMVVVEPMQSSKGLLVVTHGLLQPEPTDLNRNDDPSFAEDEIRILPNLTNNKVQVNFLTKQQGNVTITLYDVIGKKVFIKKLVNYGFGQTEEIFMQGLATGTYLMHIDLQPTPGSVYKKGSFKIVKY